MAQVKVNIPGIGDVIAENAASEETLLKLLAAMNKSDKTKKDEEKRLKNARDKEADSIEKATGAFTKMGAVASTSAAATDSSAKKTKDATETTSSAFSKLGKDTANFGGSLAKTLTSLTASVLTSYDAMAKDPIGAAAGVINTGIDLVNQGSKVATGLLGAIPLVGDGLRASAQAATDFAATLAKTANDVMAAEFKKSTAALASYTKQGASFAGGMTEMRTVANDAGLSLETLSKASATASADLRLAGLTQGEGVAALAKGMKGVSSTLGNSGKSLRDEMLALGYSYEEQTALVGQVMAMDKAAGNNKKMTDEELARATASYAKDLKVLADITGKDAKKAMEEAAKKSMEADIMAGLSPEEAKKFQSAYAAMPDYAKKGFLEYVSTGGTAIADASTNIAMSQNAEFEKLIKGSYDNIKDQSKSASDVQKETLKQTAIAGQAQKDINKENGAAIGQATRLTGALSGTSDILNGLSADSTKSAEAVDASTDAAKKQAEATDATTEGYQRITQATNDFAVKMEKFTGSNLDVYAEMLATSMQKLLDAVGAGVDAVVKKKADDKAAEEDAKKKSEAKAERDKAYEGGSFLQKYFGLGRTQDQVAADNKYYEANGAVTNPDFENAIQMAEGGIAQGDIKGYQAVLHGTEAVVPLPDGKSIPIQPSESSVSETSIMLDELSLLSELSVRQLESLQEMLAYMRSNADYSRQILNNSY
jgi:hypothetical protein